MMRGCVFALMLSAVLLAAVFGMGAYVTNSLTGGGAVALIIGVFCALALLVYVLTGKVVKP